MPDTNDFAIHYHTLPEHMRDAAREYVEGHHMPGDFLQALFSNNFIGVFKHGDETNLAAIQTWATWLYNEAPGGCWGSRLMMEAWVKAGRG